MAFQSPPPKTSHYNRDHTNIQRVVEYVAVPDNASERHWAEALKSMIRVHGKGAARFAEELQRIKALKLSGDPDGTLG